MVRSKYIKNKIISVAVPELAYDQLKELSEVSGQTLPGYVRCLIYREFERLNLPLYAADAELESRTDL